MPQGRELQMERENLRRYINRKNGEAQDAVVTVSDAQIERLLRESPGLPAFFFRNADGSVWKPQDASGNFPHLPGYDGPVK